VSRGLIPYESLTKLLLTKRVAFLTYPHLFWPMTETFSLIRRSSALGTILLTRFFGREVGQDEDGQRYFRSHFKDWAGRETRWVLYAGEPEASKVPPAWRAWLQHLCDAPPEQDAKRLLPKGSSCGYVWLKPHVPNLTGSEAASLPSGHVLRRLGAPESKAQKLKVLLRETWAWTPPVE